ncbi:MAG: hypothetical protein IPI96_15735 [Saprospiraceae bacterium]|nr:hypothetical protein [Saprospiraceae bacterium]
MSKTSNGTPCDSCFVITSGLNGKLKHCLHISQLRDLILGGNGSIDSVYLVNNSDGSYTLINENDTNYDFGYDFLESGDTLFLTDLAGHKVDYVILKPFQTLSWDPVTGELGISYGNTVIIDVGSGGNGIYGGSDTVPNETHAYIATDSMFYMGDFTSLPSINATDRGIIWKPNDGVSIYGGQDGSGHESHAIIGSTGVTLRHRVGVGQYARLNLDDPGTQLIYGGNTLNIDNDSTVISHTGNVLVQGTNVGIVAGGSRGNDGDRLTSIGGYAVWLPSCCDTFSGGGGGGFTLDSVLLKLSGNVMTSKVNTTSDTSLVIGTNALTFVSDTLKSVVNGVASNGIYFATFADTDDQQVDTFGINNNYLRLSLQDDGVILDSVNLAPYLDNTDNQYLDTATFSNDTLILSIFGDGQAAKKINIVVSDNQKLDTFELVGNTIRISVENDGEAYKSIDLSSFLDNTDDQTIDVFSTSGNTISISAENDGEATKTATIINSLTHGSTNNDITVTVNGLPASTTIINSNRLVLGNDSLKTQINGIVSNAVPLDSILLNGITNSIGLSGNTITSTVNTISDTCLAIGNNTLSYDQSSSIMTSSLNGVSDTAYMGNFNVIQYVDSIKTKIDANSGLFSTGWSLYQDSQAANYISWDSLGYLNYKNGTFSTYAGFPIGVMPYTTTGMNAAKIKVNDSTTSNVHYLHVNNKMTGTLIGDHTISNTHWIDTITQSYRSMTAGAASSLQRGLVMDTMGMIGIGLTTAQPQYELDVTGSTRLNGHIYDINNSNGSNGEVLTRTITGVDWRPTAAPSANLITPSQITSDQTDYNPTGFDDATVVRLSGDSGFRAIQSMAAQTDGEEKTFVNVGSYPLYFPPEHSTGTASQRITYYEDIILMPKKSIKMMYDGTTSRWIPTTDYDVKGCSKVVDYQMNAGSITNGDLDFWSPLVVGSGAAFSVGAATSTYPYAYVNGATGTTATGYAVATMAKTSSLGSQALAYISSSHISISSDVIIPTLSDGTDSFTVYMQISSDVSTPFTNHGFGIAYSHGMFGGNWTGYQGMEQQQTSKTWVLPLQLIQFII